MNLIDFTEDKIPTPVAHAPKDDPMAPATCTIALTHLELAATGMELGACRAAVTPPPPLFLR